MRSHVFKTTVYRDGDVHMRFTTLEGHQGYKSAWSFSRPGDRIETRRMVFEDNRLIKDEVCINETV
jgi:hypothetical protein